MPRVVASNTFLINWVGNSLFPKLQSNLKLRLYRNPINVTPDTIFSDLIESNFPGYLAQPLDTEFHGPKLVVPGEVVIEANVRTFRAIAADPQRVCGAYVTYFSSLLATMPFDSQQLVTAGASWPVRFSFQIWALAVACG